MAFITFMAHRKPVATCQLRSGVCLGRSLDCDIYVPDVFVSRHHCRFERRDGNWYVVDTDSHNGVWRDGQRQESFLLIPGDVVEIGTIAVTFNGGDVEGPSKPAPYGMGLGVTELMDTVYAEELRPSEYTKRQAARRMQWEERVKRQVEREPEDDLEPIIDTAPWNSEDWAELDLEVQIVAGQAQMTDWEAPIFNPKCRAAMLAAAREPGALPAPQSVRLSKHDSIDDEVADRQDAIHDGRMAMPALLRTSWLMAARSLLPMGKGTRNTVVDGVQIETYGWRDWFVDGLKLRGGSALSYARMYPAQAAGFALAGLIVCALALKFTAPMMHRGPHLYVPPVRTASK